MEIKLVENEPYDIGTFKQLASLVSGEVKKVIVGKEDLIQDLLIALLAEGNVMLDGAPGLAKTTIAKTFASMFDLDFKRIQFVPDILPSDITGTYVYNQKNAEFMIVQGPIFTNILLVDEVNRASPKTQSSLLEAMEEKQVTIEGNTFSLPRPFMVITTQNQIDVIGTFPLPEAQVDRFMFKLKVDYPGEDDEMKILRMKLRDESPVAEKLMGKDEVANLIRFVKSVYVDEKVLTYIKNIVMASRAHEKLLIGASPRASIALMKASRAVAALEGRTFVIPDDIKYLAPKVLNHRLVLKPEYEFEKVTTVDIIDEILRKTKVPE